MAAHSSTATNPQVSADHHLWRNGRLWWVAFTVHLPPWQKERVRLSLGTDDLNEARRRRDELLRRYPQERGCTLSLRCAPVTSTAARRRARPAGRAPQATAAPATHAFDPDSYSGWRGGRACLPPASASN